MPSTWGQSIAAVITVADAQGVEVKKIKATIHNGHSFRIDVATLAPARYTIKVIVGSATDSVKELQTYFLKTANCNWVALKLVPACELAPAPGIAHRGRHADKPVIYLYPQATEDIAVKLNFKGILTTTIPSYDSGWQVSATPAGVITNHADGKEYPYLFWEGMTDKDDWDMQTGFVVSADSTRQFLQNTLPQIGLQPKECNEFIDYWLPRLQKNPYNLIHFAGKEYEDIAPLVVTPAPDTMLRVFMVFTSVKKKHKAAPQQFAPFMRKGFTLVEWGGLYMDNKQLKNK